MSLAAVNSDKLYDDLNFLLSTIRVRENNFILLLERLRDCSEPDRSRELNRFLQEELKSAETIQQVSSQHSGAGYTDPKISELIGRFWSKLLKLIRVSLERLKLLGLLNRRIWDAYTEVIALLNSVLVSTDLRMLRMLEAVFRRRYMSLLEESTIQQRYIESTTDKDTEEKKQDRTAGRKRLLDDFLPQKMKSLNREFNKKRSEQSIQKRFTEQNCMRLLKIRSKADEDIYGLLDIRTDVSQIDSKKSRELNALALYDQLFNRNIPNHKIIAKYIFGARRNRQILRTCLANGSTRQVVTVSVKPKILLNAQKECLNKSARKGLEKQPVKEKLAATTTITMTKKSKKKISEDMDLEHPQQFSGSRLRRLDQKITKVRPKTAKLSKQQLRQLRLNLDSGKSRCRKLFKKVARV